MEEMKEELSKFSTFFLKTIMLLLIKREKYTFLQKIIAHLYKRKRSNLSGFRINKFLNRNYGYIANMVFMKFKKRKQKFSSLDK